MHAELKPTLKLRLQVRARARGEFCPFFPFVPFVPSSLAQFLNGKLENLFVLFFAFADRVRQGAAIQRTMGPAATRIQLLRSDRAAGLWFALAADLLRTERKRQRSLPGSVSRLRGDARKLAEENGRSAVRPGLLRDRIRQALLPRDTALRDTGDDTEDTNATGTAATDHPVRAVTLLPDGTGSGE